MARYAIAFFLGGPGGDYAYVTDNTRNEGQIVEPFDNETREEFVKRCHETTDWDEWFE